MQKIINCLVIVLLGAFLTLAPARAATPVALVVNVDLEKLSENKKEVSADLGDGVSVKITNKEQSSLHQDLLVFDRGQKFKNLEPGKFMQVASFVSGPTRYWIISAFSGGAHCCGVYSIFCRPEPGRPLRYLGTPPGNDGEPVQLKGSILSAGEEIYFAALENNFDYFHESHAGTLLNNVPQVFYHLRPDSVKLDNGPFKEVYLRDGAEVDREIAKEASGRRSKPQAILAPGFGSGYDGLHFSDTLGQLLIKRTILLLYAREDVRAWQSLAADVKKYYRTARWLPELRREIQEKIRTKPVVSRQ